MLGFGVLLGFFWKACEASMEPGGKFSQSFVIQMNICILTNAISLSLWEHCHLP